MRSPWKIKYFDTRVNRDKFFTPPPVSYKNRPAVAHTYLRGALIPPAILNYRFAVHTGNTFKSFIVRPFMIGRRCGEFVVTKNLGKQIHITKKKKKKGKK